MDKQINAKLATVKAPGVTFDVTDTKGTVIASLLPVCDIKMFDDALLDSISNWRNRAKMYFRTQFTAGRQRTREWLLSTVIPGPDRVLFLVSVKGKVVGHFGLCNISPNSAELDNALRGERGGGADLFKHVERALLSIAFEWLGVDRVTAKIFSDNVLALKLHYENGMIEISRSPLQRIESPTVIEYVECDEQFSNVPFQYVTMQIDGRTYLKMKEVSCCES
jgi:RimJ/RimL family protein N-acetyltransferase